MLVYGYQVMVLVYMDDSVTMLLVSITSCCPHLSSGAAWQGSAVITRLAGGEL